VHIAQVTAGKLDAERQPRIQQGEQDGHHGSCDVACRGPALDRFISIEDEHATDAGAVEGLSEGLDHRQEQSTGGDAESIGHEQPHHGVLELAGVLDCCTLHLLNHGDKGHNDADQSAHDNLNCREGDRRQPKRRPR